MIKSAPCKASKLIASGKLTFGERVVLNRVVALLTWNFCSKCIYGQPSFTLAMGINEINGIGSDHTQYLALAERESSLLTTYWSESTKSP